MSPLGQAIDHLQTDPRLTDDAAAKISWMLRDMYGALARNVASLVELPSAGHPRPWYGPRSDIAEWEQAFAVHTETMNARRKRQARLEPHKRSEDRINRLDAYIGTPRPSKVMVWTPALTKQFLQRARGHRPYAQFHLIACRGLRRGESCGLRWSDLDLRGGTAAIRWQITQIGPDTFEGKPKSEAGEATISLDSTTIKELRAHKTRQNTERLVAGDAWTETGFLHHTHRPAGRLQRRHRAVRAAVHGGWATTDPGARPAARRRHLPAGRRIRHVVVQETLRLSSIAIAIASDIYTSVLPQLGRQAAEDTAALIHNADQHHPAGHPTEPLSAAITPLPGHAQPSGDANPSPDAGQSETHDADGPNFGTNAQAS